MKKNLHIISRVLPDSIGEELELEPGDALLSINGQPVEDVFDYRYLMNDEFVTLLIRKKNGEEIDKVGDLLEDVAGFIPDQRTWITIRNDFIICLLRNVVVHAVANAGERFDGLIGRHVGARTTGELFSDVEVLADW